MLQLFLQDGSPNKARCFPSPIVLVAPQSLKKFIGAKKKDEMRLGVFQKWHVQFKTNDEVDAYALRKIGEAIFDRSICTNNAMREVVDVALSACDPSVKAWFLTKGIVCPDKKKKGKK